MFVSFTGDNRVLIFRQFNFFKLSLRLLNGSVHTRAMNGSVTRHLSITALVKHSIIGKGTMSRTNRVLVRILTKTRNLCRHLVAKGINRSTRFSLQMIKTRRQFRTLSQRRHKSGLAAYKVPIQGILRI